MVGETAESPMPESLHLAAGILDASDVSTAFRSMTQLRTLLKLTKAERRLLATALPLVVVLRIALWVLPSPTILRMVRGLGRGRPGAPSLIAEPTSVTWAVEAASRRVPGATCLTQALAAQLLLRRHGFDSQLRLGVARDIGGEFRAHAWLERQGRIVLGERGVHELTMLPDISHARWAGRTGDTR